MSGSYFFYASKPGKPCHKSDVWFLISTLLLWGLGIFTLFICSQNLGIRFKNDGFYYVKRQLLFSAFGFAFFILMMVLNLNFIRKFSKIIIMVSAVLCLLTQIPGIGEEVNGAKRWINLPLGIGFQPSEIAKMALVIFLAWDFDRQSGLEEKNDKSVALSVFAYIGICFLIILQRDFSTMFLVAVVGFLMFFVSGQKMRWIVPIGIAVSPFLIYELTRDYRLERFIGFFNPDEGAMSFNYQVNASKNAVIEGGFWGNGIGVGLNRLNFIPEVQNDYIFAGWAEAMGFFGVIIYFILISFFAWRGYKTAFSNPDRFASYASFGFVTFIVLQSLLNCMVVCAAIPATGITLPFFSSGGSSIVVTLGMCGFVLNASRCEEKDEKYFENDEKFSDVRIEDITLV